VLGDRAAVDGAGALGDVDDEGLVDADGVAEAAV